MHESRNTALRVHGAHSAPPCGSCLVTKVRSSVGTCSSPGCTQRLSKQKCGLGRWRRASCQPRRQHQVCCWHPSRHRHHKLPDPDSGTRSRPVAACCCQEAVISDTDVTGPCTPAILASRTHSSLHLCHGLRASKSHSLGTQLHPPVRTATARRLQQKGMTAHDTQEPQPGATASQRALASPCFPRQLPGS